MTPLIQKLRELEAKPKNLIQSKESLEALLNDVGLITNPSLRIAASVAHEVLKKRAILPILLEIISL